MASFALRTLGIGIACIVLGEPALSQPRTLEFRGLFIGGQTSPDRVMRTVGIPCREQFGETFVCRGTLSINTIPVDTEFVVRQSVLQRIDMRFSSQEFDKVYSALKEGYGSPDNERLLPFDNGSAAQPRQQQAVWMGPNGTQMYAVRFSSDAYHSAISYTTVSERASLRAMGLARGADL